MAGFPGTWLQNGCIMAPKVKKTMKKKSRVFFERESGAPFEKASVLKPFWRSKRHQNPKKNDEKKRLDFNYRFFEVLECFLDAFWSLF